MTPFFSIIIPVYNVAPYLRECLDSVLAQTFTDWESICVDDGSADGSSDILDEYAAKDKRFKVIHQVNLGVSSARNVGLAAAKGEYITFIDGDDIVMREWLSEAEAHCKRGGADIVRLMMQYYRGGDSINTNLRKEFTVYSGVDAKRWEWLTFIHRGWSCVAFVRHDLLIESGNMFPLGMRIREDNIYWLNFNGYLKRCIQSEYAGYLYRVRLNSAWYHPRKINDSCRYFDELLIIWERRKSEICKQGWMNDAILSVAESVWEELQYWLNHCEPSEKWHDAQMEQSLRRLMASGIDISIAMKRKYRFAYRFFIVTGSLNAFHIVVMLKDAYCSLLKIKNWFVGLYSAMR